MIWFNALAVVIMAGAMWFSGYSMAKGKHHRLMAEGWDHLSKVAHKRAVESDDVIHAFARKW